MKKSSQIKNGINLHVIKTTKFKTNIVAVFLRTSLSKEKVTKNSLISSILRRGTMKYPTLENLSIELEEMYGGDFNLGLDKVGDNQVFKYYVETINDKYLPEKNLDLLNKSIDVILELAFNPLIEEGSFKKEYFEQEKVNVKRRIESKTDNKAAYAYARLMEEMYKDKSYALDSYGNCEDLEKIDLKELYQDYLELINNCRIDIYVAGDVPENLEEVIGQNEKIQRLPERIAKYSETEEETIKQENNVVIEKKDVTQGNLLIGLDVDIAREERIKMSVYNKILRWISKF